MVVRFQSELHPLQLLDQDVRGDVLVPVELRDPIARNALVEVEEKVDSKDQSASYWLGHMHGSHTVEDKNFS
jgi:hypothetical protein